MLAPAQIAREVSEGFGNDSLIPAFPDTPPPGQSINKLAIPGTNDTAERASFAAVQFKPETFATAAESRASILDPPPAGLPAEMLTDQWAWRWFPMGGWVYHGVTVWMQREDQGQDLEVLLGHHIIAPGWGKCVKHLSDAPFPNGFGSPYAVIYLPPQKNCRFAGNFWYLGHDNGTPIVPVGHWFHSEEVLATPNHSLNQGRGWTECGIAPNGFPGAFGNGARWHWAFAPVKKWSAF